MMGIRADQSVASFFVLVWLTLSSVKASSETPSLCQALELAEHPVLCRYLDMARGEQQSQELLARELHDSAQAQGWLIKVPATPIAQSSSRGGAVATQRKLTTSHRASSSTTTSQGQQLPVVFAHGMGDSCFNSGMQWITNHTAELLDNDDAYTVCIPIGSTPSEDTNNGYFLNMDASVDVFAEAVQKDQRLKNGFHAIGFSQGNNVVRGYIAKVNSPAVHTFVSVNGVNAGEGAVPYCRPDLTESRLGLPSLCDLLMEQASRGAYTEFAQEHSFQANYWRDPRPSEWETYQKYSQLAVWNNEAGFVNETLLENWAKTERFVWVLATEDGMVWPREGEHWGAPDPADPFHHILPMNETEWYKQDLFGLRTAQEAGKNYFESFKGDHLAFTEEDFERWVATYLKTDSHSKPSP